MFQVHPTNSDQLVRSVQHDYQQAANDYRLSAKSDYRPSFARLGAVLITLIITFFAITQTAVL